MTSLPSVGARTLGRTGLLVSGLGLSCMSCSDGDSPGRGA